MKDKSLTRLMLKQAKDKIKTFEKKVADRPSAIDLSLIHI